MLYVRNRVKVLIVMLCLVAGYVIFEILELGSISKHYQIFFSQEENSTNQTKYTSFLMEELSKLQAESIVNATLINELKKKIEDMIHLNETHTQEDLKRDEELIQLKSLLAEQEQLNTNANSIVNQSENFNNTNADLEHTLFEPHEVCAHVPRPSFTASHLWYQHMPKILEASRNPNKPELDDDDSMNTFEHLLKNISTPERFRRAIRHLPTFHHDSVRHVFQIIERRIQDPQNHPPLRLAIFGGSVTIGRGCDETTNRMQDYGCAWPRRFELFVNQFFQKDIIKVYNLGIGGTGSGTASNIIEYWMYDDKDLASTGPDVIINSYSTNDSLPPWVGTGRVQMTTHDVIKMTSDMQRNSIQNFLRTALTSKNSCEIQPLVLHVDDSLGPQQEQVLGEMSYISVLTQLAKWYDTGVVSYPEVVRDIVYENKSDKVFFNEKDVHYGHFAHQMIAWSLGFAAIELLSNYCDDEYRRRDVESLQTTSPKNLNETQKPISALSPDNNRRSVLLPPPLTESLLWNNVTVEFQSLMVSNDEETVKLNCSAIASNERNPCEVAWISTPGGFGVGNIDNFMKKYSENIIGWSTENNMAAGWSNKIGWTANQPNATFSLRFANVSKDLHSLTVAHLISYGEKWEGSLARFTGMDRYGNQIFTQDISGVHNITASPTMTQKILFSQAIQKGETLTVKVDLVSGKTFKVMGFMLCAF